MTKKSSFVTWEIKHGDFKVDRDYNALYKHGIKTTNGSNKIKIALLLVAGITVLMLSLNFVSKI